MPIHYQEASKVFTLSTNHSTYQMKVNEHGILLHLYYGKSVEGDEMDYLIPRLDRAFSPSPGDYGKDRLFSLDVVPQEYPTFGVGDFRSPCLSVINRDGSNEVDLRYVSHQIRKGKPGLEGLPAVYGTEEECHTLSILMADSVTGVEAELLFSVFPEYDAITRAAVIRNSSPNQVVLERALSCCLDFPQAAYDFIHFYGKHMLERCVERQPVGHGKIRVDSVRGATSHQQNSFVVLCDENAGEEFGDCYGFSLVYSGNFMAEAEVSQFGQTRVVMGVNDFAFHYVLQQGEMFTTPEVVMCFSGEGLGAMSRSYHRLYREHLCRGKYKTARRPVLINNWEATYFEFDDDKLVDIARDAASLGVEMLVMDDGWFGKREDDNSGLGDWFVNEKKIKGGLKPLVDRINAMGMKFGIWFEPEMVSEDSELYRSHPDWCLRTAGRAPSRGRNQLVLDFSRQEVVEYLFTQMSKILSSANISYVKWDFNRHLTNVWSAALPADRQGEVYHRFVLGVYALLERLLEAFPSVLFEGCSGGGGRFDAGMLYYTPQIWCSDNTDAIDRLKIQYGTSFCYPISSVGSHVSVCPNHGNGRITPLHTRGIVAMSGTFGYELDITRMTTEEKEMVKEQISQFKRNYDTITTGDYYRLTNPYKNTSFTAWQFVAQDKKKSILNVVFLSAEANRNNDYVKLRGLDPNARYFVHGLQREYSGSTLMNAGLLLPMARGDYSAVCWELEKV